MNGYCCHTYQWINAEGESFWVKYHFKTDQGVEFFTQDEADRWPRSTPTTTSATCYEHIERGEFPTWTLKVQIMPFEDAMTYRFNPFDLTKVWPHRDYPCSEVGQLTLEPQPRPTTRRGRAGGVRAEQLRAGHRPVARTRCSRAEGSPTPTPTATGSASTTRRSRSTRRSARQQLHQRRPHAHPNAPTRSTRPTPTAAPGRPGANRRRWRVVADGDMVRLHIRCEQRTTTGDRPAPWFARCWTTPPAERLVNNIVGHLLNGVPSRSWPGLRVLAQHRQGARRPDRQGVRGKQDEQDPKAAEQANPARADAQAKA